MTAAAAFYTYGALRLTSIPAQLVQQGSACEVTLRDFPIGSLSETAFCPHSLTRGTGELKIS